jgi:acyl-CoA reductase-like NAD-dependent aldehyde dehydrogenase
MTSFGLCPTTSKKEKVMTYQSLNPATGKLLKKFEELTDKQLETKIAAAATCFETWRHKSYAERAAIVAKAAAWLRRLTSLRTR